MGYPSEIQPDLYCFPKCLTFNIPFDFMGFLMQIKQEVLGQRMKIAYFLKTLNNWPSHMFFHSITLVFHSMWVYHSHNKMCVNQLSWMLEWSAVVEDFTTWTRTERNRSMVSEQGFTWQQSCRQTCTERWQSWRRAHKSFLRDFNKRL